MGAKNRLLASFNDKLICKSSSVPCVVLSLFFVSRLPHAGCWFARLGPQSGDGPSWFMSCTSPSRSKSRTICPCQRCLSSLAHACFERVVLWNVSSARLSHVSSFKFVSSQGFKDCCARCLFFSYVLCALTASFLGCFRFFPSPPTRWWSALLPASATEWIGCTHCSTAKA